MLKAMHQLLPLNLIKIDKFVHSRVIMMNKIGQINDFNVLEMLRIFARPDFWTGFSKIRPLI